MRTPFATTYPSATVLDRKNAVLAPRPFYLLVPGGLEPAHDGGACVCRIDHVVDERPPRRDVRRYLVADDADHLVASFLLFVFGHGLDLLTEDDVHRSLGAHDRDLCRRPSDDQIWFVRSPVHDVIAGA